MPAFDSPTATQEELTAIDKRLAELEAEKQRLFPNRRVNTLILTHSRQLLDQWKERIQSFTTGVNVGIIGGGKKQPTQEIDIATYQSLIDRKDNTISEYVQRYGQVIIDECHHISAPRYEMLLNEVRAVHSRSHRDTGQAGWPSEDHVHGRRSHTPQSQSGAGVKIPANSVC
ncbi:DEAD/DEAH box helicase [Marinobacterium aestuarii]|uniref:DEAD/DEAH box helicase n=1 Tax=Marinobacterium aestuarii TaxID=1821621 RepID=UPI001D1044EE|nr:DEAD/DEAH box helicase family protein [Marinobacterium aestuarii]